LKNNIYTGSKKLFPFNAKILLGMLANDAQHQKIERKKITAPLGMKGILLHSSLANPYACNQGLQNAFRT
jgi:hypothetical protein